MGGAGVVSDAREGVDEVVVGSLDEGGGGGVGTVFSLPGVDVNDRLSNVFKAVCTLAAGDDLDSGTGNFLLRITSSPSRSFADSAPDETGLSKALTIGERVLIGERTLTGER